MKAPDPRALQARALQARALQALQARRDLLGLALIARRHANPSGNSGPSRCGKGTPAGHLRPRTSGRAEAGLRRPDGDVDGRKHCGPGPLGTGPGDRLLQPPPVDEISRAGGGAGHGGRTGRGQAAWALTIWCGMIPVLVPFEVCEDLRFRDLGTGQVPAPAPSTAQEDRRAGQRWGTGKGSQHPRDHEGSPLKERPSLDPAPAAGPGLRPWRCQRQAPVSTALSLAAYARGSPSGLLDLRRQVSRHFGTGHTRWCPLSLRPGTRL
jgi:hypothetical protein